MRDGSRGGATVRLQHVWADLPLVVGRSTGGDRGCGGRGAGGAMRRQGAAVSSGGGGGSVELGVGEGAMARRCGVGTASTMGSTGRGGLSEAEGDAAGGQEAGPNQR
jgi:hypothetical protein